MTSNLGKRLDKLHKEITELGVKGGAFHYIVGDANESSEAKLTRLQSEGHLAPGDEYMAVDVPWLINQLKGNSDIIPEGNPHDPLADPGLSAEPLVTSWGAQREREERWKKHERQIERDGQRYEGDKKQDTTWR